MKPRASGGTFKADVFHKAFTGSQEAFNRSPESTLHLTLSSFHHTFMTTVEDDVTLLNTVIKSAHKPTNHFCVAHTHTHTHTQKERERERERL